LSARWLFRAIAEGRNDKDFIPGTGCGVVARIHFTMILAIKLSKSEAWLEVLQQPTDAIFQANLQQKPD